MNTETQAYRSGKLRRTERNLADFFVFCLLYLNYILPEYYKHYVLNFLWTGEAGLLENYTYSLHSRLLSYRFRPFTFISPIFLPNLYIYNMPNFKFSEGGDRLFLHRTHICTEL
jgi:hypothetical protein